MRKSRATARYAKALLQLSIEQKSLEQSYNDMLIINKACSESKELCLLLKSPIIKTDQKRNILQEIFESKIGDISMNFIKIITNKKRESLLNSIASVFISQYKKHKNIKEATITTAQPLNLELKQEIIKYIKKNGDVEVELTEVVDKNIIGGTVIQLGDKQLDTSVSSEISELRKRFNKNLYLQDF